LQVDKRVESFAAFMKMDIKISHLAKRFLLGVLAIWGIAFSQTTNITGIINIYTPVLTQGPCANVITVGSSAGFEVGDTVLIIQMQGAIIDESNSAAYGTISSYNGAGFFEKAEIQAIAGGTIHLTNDLANVYNFGGNVQMVSVPVYQNATVVGSLTGQAWNGSTGGVVVLDVRGTLNIVGGEINMNSKGFRGGGLSDVCPNSCNFSQNNTDYFYANPNYRASFKGEGIANLIVGKERGRGAQANGGGGGNDHNAGGGGGSNLSSGGIGSRNNEPGAFTCKGYNPGEAGRVLNSSAGTRLFMGGGGGAGHGNNGATGGCPANGGSTAGTAGGGIIIVMAGTLNANGDAFRTTATFAGTANGDGAGGGGSGGTVLLDVTNYSGTPFIIHATGGNGGATSGFAQNRCYGPGGGGSGGAVFVKTGALPGSITTNFAGGTPGVILSSINACNGTTGTALAGAAGVVVTNAPGVTSGTTMAVAPCILPVEYAYFNAQPSAQNTVRLDWGTSSEFNNTHFEVEHATDVVNFVGIGQVSSLGQNGEGAEYGFIHRKPALGDNWYRIRQFDRDGRSSVSEIKHVVFAPTAVTIQNLFPNPVNAPHQVTMELMSPAAAAGRLSVLNLMGQIVQESPIFLESGLNSMKISTLGLQSGIYFLKVNAGKQGEVVMKLKVN
jgi:hypothetical protein